MEHKIQRNIANKNCLTLQNYSALFLLLSMFILSACSSASAQAVPSISQCSPRNQFGPYADISPYGINGAGNLQRAQVVRTLYDCFNAGTNHTALRYNVILDLLEADGNVPQVEQYFQEMKQYGLFPTVRLATYMDGNGNWVSLGQEDTRKFAKRTAGIIESTQFSEPVGIYLGNEVNLYKEGWGSDPEGYGKSFAAFTGAVKGTEHVKVLAPPMSYGATDKNGMKPNDFLHRMFQAPISGIDGIAVNVYANDLDSMTTEALRQAYAFYPYRHAFNVWPPPVYIAEAGLIDPVTKGALTDCTNPRYPQLMQPLLIGMGSKPLNPEIVQVAFACFDNNDKAYLPIRSGNQIFIVR